MASEQVRRCLQAAGDLRANDIVRFVRRRLHLAARSPVLCLCGAFFVLMTLMPAPMPHQASESLSRTARSADDPPEDVTWDRLPLVPASADDEDQLIECTDDEDEELELPQKLSEESKCKVHLLLFGSSRLGNLMIKYSVLYALRDKYNINVFTTSEQASSLNKYFHNLTIGPPPKEYKKAKWHFTWFRNLEVLLPCPTSIGKRFPCFRDRPDEHCIVVADWPPGNGFPVFSPYLPRLAREEFIFPQTLQNEVQDYLRKASGRRKDPVFIGVHVRGTDQNVDFVNNYHRDLPSLQYFATAMAYYRTMYKKVVFIVATDEPKFAMRSVPNKFGDVYYTSHKQDVSNPIAFDMAAISLCNHTIISVGTFSFWGSYLSGGMVVAPSRYQGDDPGRYDLEIKHWDRQQEWFSWS
ncbi:galactoside alpha-(1,2)-fucosyltransferase 2-like [Amphibalanus amphitrite]|uniref:galactoside alpha-(1,2)-fucosyltransferase 2-like n=1 Tax=Amphibalanus amphitrite TaxID=1232801 RepID=UPI001C90BBA6|nr:galactoside alpha-(1,2)-fucosyltransferase 2-like [Amphibalanus amphitrite]